VPRTAESIYPFVMCRTLKHELCNSLQIMQGTKWTIPMSFNCVLGQGLGEVHGVLHVRVTCFKDTSV
jgi:hypothetical protein